MIYTKLYNANIIHCQKDEEIAIQIDVIFFLFIFIETFFMSEKKIKLIYLDTTSNAICNYKHLSMLNAFSKIIWTYSHLPTPMLGRHHTMKIRCL